ncbi:insulinoma-associated protein 2 [Hippocampus comes]|uniref:INSM transcriptional repressor 2 n=1 Tax=Hippocampus comes TaxID=109280 RepID=A0A3Q2XZ21_HIPCM|nr:PREDICTED: insulinoma-associated protein 2-like [Hippocampus comes]
MPRGFLVKRTRRCSASYRVRKSSKLATCDNDKDHRAEAEVSEPEPVKENHVWGVPSPDVAPPPAPREDSAGVTEVWSLHVESALEAEADRRAQLPDSEVDTVTPVGDFSCFFPPPPPLIEARSSRLLEPHGEVEKASVFPETCSSSAPGTELPFLVSSTPTSMRVAASNTHFSPYGPAPKYDNDMARLFPPLMNHQHQAAGRKRSFPESNRANRTKANRKLTFEDEVTTSPVLGLRIKKESPEAARRQHKSSGSQPLGEFICQLCKEEYADPLSLAQHKCSRIVRVEYRCPECDKVFSCPANLASHRRWHKPRPSVVNPGRGQDLSVNKLDADGKENELLCVNQHQGARDSSAVPDSSSPLFRQESPPPGLLMFNGNSYEPLAFVRAEEDAEVYDCRYCGKKFRRQAYLKKHMATHDMGTGPSPPTSSRPVVFACHLCGARFPSADIRDKHRVWHAVRDELLGGAGGHGFGAEGYGVDRGCEQQVFACKHCPATFLGSPGLTRHLSKCHPGDNTHVIMHMAVRHGDARLSSSTHP